MTLHKSTSDILIGGSLRIRDVQIALLVPLAHNNGLRPVAVLLRVELLAFGGI